MKKKKKKKRWPKKNIKSFDWKKTAKRRRRGREGDNEVESRLADIQSSEHQERGKMTLGGGDSEYNRNGPISLNYKNVQQWYKVIPSTRKAPHFSLPTLQNWPNLQTWTLILILNKHS
jgi:hypothetical protein